MAVHWADARVEAALAVLGAHVELAPLNLPKIPSKQRQQLQEAALAYFLAAVLDAAADHLKLSAAATVALLLRSRYRPLDTDLVDAMAPVRPAGAWWWPASWVSAAPAPSPYVCPAAWEEAERKRNALVLVADELTLQAQAVAAALAALPPPWALALLHDFVEVTIARGLGPRHVYAYLYRCFYKAAATTKRPAAEHDDSDS